MPWPLSPPHLDPPVHMTVILGGGGLEKGTPLRGTQEKLQNRTFKEENQPNVNHLEESRTPAHPLCVCQYPSTESVSPYAPYSYASWLCRYLGPIS